MKKELYTFGEHTLVKEEASKKNIAEHLRLLHAAERKHGETFLAMQSAIEVGTHPKSVVEVAGRANGLAGVLAAKYSQLKNDIIWETGYIKACQELAASLKVS